MGGPILLSILISSTLGGLTAQAETKPQPASHHVFISHDFIWTFEMVEEGETLTPVLNVITFTKGEWRLSPRQIRIISEAGERARVRKFSMETGERPYITPLFRVLGNSFIGIDLIGDFDGFSKPTEVTIDLGDYRYHLKPLDLFGFENLAEKINRVNYDSPNVRDDFEVLEIERLGRRTRVPRGR